MFQQIRAKHTFLLIFLRVYEINVHEMLIIQGSHSTWKNESTPGKPVNVMDF